MVVLDIETEDGQREALRRMLTIWVFDTRTTDLFNDGELPGLAHLYVGEEAVGVGTCLVFESGDYIMSTHRGHGHCIAKGLDPDLMMAELFGKADDYCNGEGRSMHIADVDARMFGANGTVGAEPPLTTGAALTSHLKGEDTVALAFFGDGVAAQGQVYEAINLAVTWSFPTIFLVENSQYDEATPVEKQHNVQNLSETAEAYNIPGSTIDGVDITVVYEAAEEARKRAADGEGPTSIEAETYRYHGHFEGDQQPYRTEEDMAIRRDRDTIEAFKRRLVGARTITEAEFDEMKAETDQQIEDAVGKAEDAAHPDPSRACEDMFNTVVPEISDFFSGMRADGGENRRVPRLAAEPARIKRKR